MTRWIICAAAAWALACAAGAAQQRRPAYPGTLDQHPAIDYRGTPPTDLSEGRCGGNNNAPFNAPLVVDPANADNLYVGARSLWRTTNSTAAAPPCCASRPGPRRPP